MLSYRKHNLWRAFVDFRFDNDKKSGFSASKHTHIKARVQKPYPVYDQNGQNQLKSIPHLWPKRLKNPTLWGRTYLYSPYKGVPPGGLLYITFNSSSEWEVSKCGYNGKYFAEKKNYSKGLSIHCPRAIGAIGLLF